jgi:transcriptional regulator with XRE-family HTH domain
MQLTVRHADPPARAGGYGVGSRTKLQLAADRRTIEVRRALGAELRRNREDQGLRQRSVAAEAGIDRAHLSRIESGGVASVATLSRVSASLGGDLSLRFHPGTGTHIRDHIQSAMIEALLTRLSPRWKRFLEVPVYRPVRGVVDIVLHDPSSRQLVALEVHSEIRRLEQLLRWTREKQDALPSAEIWEFAAARGLPTVSGLLVLRSTPTTRALVGQHAATFQAAYPARAAEVWTSLTGTAPWPGAGLIWASVRDGRATILDRPPRGVRSGR